MSDNFQVVLSGLAAIVRDKYITGRRLGRATDPLDIALKRAIKKLLDPNGLMNPGKIFAAGGT